MDARELLNTSEFKWMMEKGSSQIDFDGNKISGSKQFKGSVPSRMTSAIIRSLKKCGAVYNGSTYSVSSGDTEKDFSISVSFGQKMSTQNRIIFNVCPYTW